MLEIGDWSYTGITPLIGSGAENSSTYAFGLAFSLSFDASIMLDSELIFSKFLYG